VRKNVNLGRKGLNLGRKDVKPWEEGCKTLGGMM